MLSEQIKAKAAEILSDHSGEKVNIRSFAAVGGGCINAAGKLETNAGPFFLKYNNAKAYPGMFEAEAKGLGILAEADAVNVPKPIFAGNVNNETFILTEWIESGKRQKDFWEKFGESLAKLHGHHQVQFGLDHNNYIGSQPQYNDWRGDWPEFFIEMRLEKQIEIARNHGKISSRHITKFNRLYKKLNEIFPKEKPSLIHGDLWSGNFLTGADGYSAIVDPAVYYGHREIELSFTKLFGGFDREFYQSYEAHFPLEKGFEKREDIYNLYPLMVHVNLFGGGYLASVENILRRF